MQVVYPRCCGLDVHQKSVTACVMLTEAEGRVQTTVRTVSTMTADLLVLDDWLTSLGVTHVAMESTGVYWRPVYNILEDRHEIILVNAQHIKAVPGRKTDVKDSEWLADLLRHGLLKGSFIPPAPIRALRELTRYRATLVQHRTLEINHLYKTLEGANIKLGAVVSRMLGVSSRAMLEALVAGEQDPEVLAQLARGPMRAKLPDLRRALTGRVQPYHLILIEQILAQIDAVQQSIERLEAEIERSLTVYQEEMALLQTIPGVGKVAAATIIAEIGTEMSRFPSAHHLAAWAGLCPGNRQSGGKRLPSKAREGDTWLKAALGEAAWAVARKHDTYLSAQYHRLARRRGKQKAIVAVAHSILVIAYHILHDRQPYRDLGTDYFDTLDATRIQRHHVTRLQALGFDVTLTPKAA
jgi:transposase